MIRAVVFDLGKVLVDFDYRIAVRRLAAHSKKPIEAIDQLLHLTPLLMDYETGLINSREFYDRVRQETGFSGSFEEFADAFGDIFVAIEPMVQLQAGLRRHGLPCYVFSNTNEIAVGHIRKRFPFFANFDGYVLSYEHRAMNPHQRLYEVVERCSGRRSSELLYLDDRPENVAAGAERGWQVILQENPEKTLAAVKSLGLLNGAPG